MKNVTHSADELPTAPPEEQPKHHPQGPSSLNYLEVCCGWVKDPNQDTTRAEEGTRIHRAIETRNTLGLDTEQVEQVNKCLALFDRYTADAVSVQQEVRLVILRGLTFGTADVKVLKRMPTGKLRLIVIDWKAGFEPVAPVEKNRQGHAYLSGAADLHPEADEVEVVFALPRQDVVDRCVFHRKQIPALETAIRTIIARVHQYQASSDTSMLNPTVEVCGRCGNLGKCERARPIFIEIAKKYDPLFVPVEVHSSLVTQNSQMYDLMRMAPIFEKMAESIKEHSKRFIADNGPILDPEGRPAFEVRSKDGARKLNDQKLGEIIELLIAEGLTEREILANGTYTLGTLLDLIADKAPKGKKGKRRGEVETKLQEIDAIVQANPTRELKKIRQPEILLKDSSENPLTSP